MEKLDISDNIQFIKFNNGMVCFSVNGEKKCKNFDKLPFFLKKLLTLKFLEKNKI